MTVASESVSPANSASTAIDDYELYCVVRQIADKICELSVLHAGWFEDWRRQPPNHFYYQTSSGLFIELSHGKPGRLWTPWGCWSIIGSAERKWEKVWELVAPMIGATAPEQAPVGERSGPIFAVTRFGDKVLPPAIAAETERFTPYDDAKAAWNKLSEIYAFNAIVTQ